LFESALLQNISDLIMQAIFVKAMQNKTNNCYVVCFPADLC